MHPVERTILQWIACQAAPEIRPAIASQFEQIEVSAREYTNGGGVFVGLTPGKSGTPVSAEWRVSYSAIEGPELKSPELEAGASATLHINQDGLAESLEIWAHANDYPTNRHPEVVSLAQPSGTHIDLRGQGN